MNEYTEEWLKNIKDREAHERLIAKCVDDITRYADRHGSPSDYGLHIAVEKLDMEMRPTYALKPLRDAVKEVRLAVKGKEYLEYIDQRAACIVEALDAYEKIPECQRAFDNGGDIKTVKRILLQCGSPGIAMEGLIAHASAQGIPEDRTRQIMAYLCEKAEAIKTQKGEYLIV